MGESGISLGEFIFQCLKEAIRTTWDKADLGATVVGVVIPVVIHFVPAWEHAMNNIAWEIPVACLASVGATRLLLSPFLIYRDEDAKLAERRVKELTTPVIKIVGLTPPQTNHYTPVTSGLQYRIDVFNTSGALSAHNAEVKLIQTEPSISELHLPLPLEQMHDRGNPRETSFSLNPQDHKYIDLVRTRSDFDGFFVCHVVSGILSGFKWGEYVLTVKVTADNTPPDIKQFRVWGTDGNLHCEMLGQNTGSILSSHIS
jgi:hypothetical protein